MSLLRNITRGGTFRLEPYNALCAEVLESLVEVGVGQDLGIGASLKTERTQRQVRPNEAKASHSWLDR